MTMQPIQSSMLSHIGYDAERLVLLVRFHPNKKQKDAGEPGDLWEYSPVVSERWDEAQAVMADPEGSIGKWFGANIKGKYDGVKVVVEAAAPPLYWYYHGESESITQMTQSEMAACSESGLLEELGPVVLGTQLEIEFYWNKEGFSGTPPIWTPRAAATTDDELFGGEA